MQEFILTQSVVNEKITDFINTLETEHTAISDYINYDDIEYFDNVFDTITEKLQENNSLDVDIIYYSNAIDYLKNNDASLSECMRIASEFGYTTENLNSELLASLLASENNRDEWQEKESEINLFFEELEEEIEDYKIKTIDLLVEVGEDYDEVSLLDIDELTEKANDLIDKINALYKEQA